MSNLVADVSVCAVAKQQSRHLQVVIGNSVFNSVMQRRSAVLDNHSQTYYICTLNKNEIYYNTMGKRLDIDAIA